MRAIRCPKLFVHSLQDEIVPFGLGLRLYREAANPKELLKIRGGHNDGHLVSEHRYLEGLQEFLAGV